MISNNLPAYRFNSFDNLSSKVKDQVSEYRKRHNIEDSSAKDIKSKPLEKEDKKFTNSELDAKFEAMTKAFKDAKKMDDLARDVFLQLSKEMDSLTIYA